MLSFFTVLDDYTTIFTLKSKSKVYQIEYDKNRGSVEAIKRKKNQDSYDIKKDNRIKI